MKYLKFAVFCFLLIPLVANANKYTLRGKNTKAEVIELGLSIRNASFDKGANQTSAKSNVETFIISTVNFKPCQPSKVDITLFMPPKGVIFSGSLNSEMPGYFKFRIRKGEEDSVLLTVNCHGATSYSFPLVD